MPRSVGRKLRENFTNYRTHQALLQHHALDLPTRDSSLQDLVGYMGVTGLTSANVDAKRAYCRLTGHKALWPMGTVGCIRGGHVFGAPG